MVGTYKKITFDYQTIDVLNSWEKSKLARKIFSEPKSKRIQAVYLYEPENLIQN